MQSSVNYDVILDPKRIKLFEGGKLEAVKKRFCSVKKCKFIKINI